MAEAAALVAAALVEAHPEPVALLVERHLAATTWRRRVLLPAELLPVALEVAAVLLPQVAEAAVALLLEQGLVVSAIRRSR